MTMNSISGSPAAVRAAPTEKRKPIKCVVWDLDNTLWAGTLMEQNAPELREGVPHVIQALDARGILQSIASRNHEQSAMARLRDLGIEEYFLYPQIHWEPKAGSIKAIAEALNIGLDSICFIDDEPFELAEMQSMLPEVLCLDVRELPQLLEMPVIASRVVTAESRSRRRMYLADIRRKQIEEEFAGPHDEFLATLDMVFAISPAQPEDLARAEELTNRTNQLNTTGYTFSREELEAFLSSPNHLLLMADLSDKFGSYGKIGMALIERSDTIWTIKLLLMSCRVMNRNVGMVMLNHILERAREAGVRLLSEFVSNDRNRMMFVTYKFAGFRQVETRENVQILEHDLASISPVPAFVALKVNL
jgi:FkbH-like protein